MEMKTMRKLTVVLIILFVMGCQTTAPTSYELNRRSGVPVALDTEDQDTSETVDKDLSKIRTGTALPKDPRKPVRLPGVVEKVWVYGHRVNEKHWLQDTWIFVEVDQEKWLGEIDSGEGGFSDEIPATAKKKGD